MKNYILLFLLSSISIMSCSQGGEPIQMNRENLINDLDYLTEKILNTHPDPYHLVGKEAFDAKIRNIKDSAELLNSDEIYVRMLDLIASIGDGHTNLWPFSYYNQFPVRFLWIQDTIRISGISEEHKQYLGARLVAINQMPIQAVAKKVLKTIPGHESEVFGHDWATYYFTLAEIMYGLGIVDSKDQIPLILKLLGPIHPNHFTMMTKKTDCGLRH